MAPPGFKTAAAQEPPSARTVMDSFHVVALTAGRLDECRRRIQRQTTRGRGRKDDPLYQARRTLRTGPTCSPMPRQRASRTCSPTTTTPLSRPPGASTSA